MMSSCDASVFADVSSVIAKVSSVVAEVSPVIGEVSPVMGEVSSVIAKVSSVIVEGASVMAEGGSVVAEDSPWVAWGRDKRVSSTVDVKNTQNKHFMVLLLNYTCSVILHLLKRLIFECILKIGQY
jgi:hypothetical protein